VISVYKQEKNLLWAVICRFFPSSIVLPVVVNTCRFFMMRASKLIEELLNWCFAEASFWWRARTFQTSRSRREPAGIWCVLVLREGAWGKREEGQRGGRNEFDSVSNSWAWRNEAKRLLKWRARCVVQQRHAPARWGRGGCLVLLFDMEIFWAVWCTVWSACLWSRAANTGGAKD